MREHRVSLLDSLRRYEDPANSRDPKVRELVTALATLEPAPQARDHFRAELRAQLVAVAPRLVAEGPAEAAQPVESPTLGERARASAGNVRPLHLARPIAVVVGVFAVFAMLLGGAVWISNKALPGDALYSLKRANENVQLSLTHGTERGKTYLSFASTRADEVKALLSHASALALSSGPNAASGVSDHTAKLVNSTLDSADSDVRNASSLLGSQGASDKSAGPLNVLTSWAPSQLGKLNSIAAGLPAGSLHDRVVTSARLVTQAANRMNAIRNALGTTCLDDATTDGLGPVPLTVCPAGAPGQPGQTTTPGKPGQGGSTQQGGNGATSNAPGTSGAGSGTAGNGSSSPGAPGSPSPSLPLPTVPSLPLPSTGPISTNSCGVSASLGPIGVGVGSCGIHVTI